MPPDPAPRQRLARTDPPGEPGAAGPGFADLGLPTVLVHALRRSGLTTALPIQTAVVPDILAGHDVLGRAATGSGKTLAFGLPLLVRVRRGAAAPHRPRGLILTPTRELALQIERALDEPAVALGLRLATAVGGVPIARQTGRLARGVDVLIATPGRLADLLTRAAVDLTAVGTVAVDEADHMAELGFADQVTALLDRLPDTAQHLLFSATLDDTVQTLVRRYGRTPVAHSAETQSADAAGSAAAVPNPAMSHYLLAVRKADRPAIVTEIAARPGRTLLFVRTQHGADKLARRLRAAGVAAVALHGGRSQQQRHRALAAYTAGTATVLVATDVAARGLHVDDISLVVHVDPAADAKDYLHRAGRTARAGAGGRVVTLVTEGEGAERERLRDELDVAPTVLRVVPGDPELSAVTGARRPSGRPIADPAAPAEDSSGPATPADGPRGRDAPGRRGSRRPPPPRKPRHRNRSGR